MIVFAGDMNGHIGYDGTLGGFGGYSGQVSIRTPYVFTLRVLPTSHHLHPSLSPVVSLSLVILHDNNNNNDRLTAFDPGQPG